MFGKNTALSKNRMPQDRFYNEFRSLHQVVIE